SGSICNGSHGGPTVKLKVLAAAAASLFFVGSVPAHEDDSGPAAGAKLGKVKFANSCSPKVQDKVQRGVAMLHSFWFPAGEALFQELANEDPNCALAAWGFASVLMNNPFVGVVLPQDVERAQGAIAKGRQM